MNNFKMTRIFRMMPMGHQSMILENFSHEFAIVMIIGKIWLQSIRFHQCTLKFGEGKIISFGILLAAKIYWPLNGTGCDCLGEQMRRATLSTHCSLAISPSFSFFFPKRITEIFRYFVSFWLNHKKKENFLTFLLLLFCSKTESQSILFACLRIDWQTPDLMRKQELR